MGETSQLKKTARGRSEGNTLLFPLQMFWGPRGPKPLEARRNGVLGHDHTGQPPRAEGVAKEGGSIRRFKGKITGASLWSGILRTENVRTGRDFRNLAVQ